MWILSEAQKRRSQWMQSITQPTQATQPTWVETPIWYTSLRNDITSVDTLDEINASKKVSDLIKHRTNIRKWISNWTISSGNEAQDYLTKRKSWLVDIFSDYMMQDKSIIKDDASADLLADLIKNDPDAIIWYMKSYIKKNYPEWYEAKNQAIDDYIMKWWKLNDVMDFVVWQSTTPYWTKEEKKEFDRWTSKLMNYALNPEWLTLAMELPWLVAEWTKRWLNKLWYETKEWNKENRAWNLFTNFLWSVRATPIKEIAWAAEILTPESSKQDLRESAMVKWATTKWYEEYKATWKLPKQYSDDYRNLYNWYDNAVNDWFVWSVEEYNNYLWDVAVATEKTFKKMADDFTETYMYNPEEAGADAGQVFWDIVDMVMIDLATAWTATPELVATKVPKLTKFAKRWWDALKWWLEFQALEDAYEWELSDVPEYAKSVMVNSILKWWMQTLWWAYKSWRWWLVDKLWWITERGREWLKWETPTSSAEKIKIIKESKWTNPERTPEKEIWKSFVKAREEVKKDVDKLYEEKRSMEREFKWDVPPEIVVDELNKTFEKALNPEEMWQQVSKVVPKFRIWESEEEAILRRQSERAAKKNTPKKSAKAEKEAAMAEEERLSKLSPEERADEIRLKEIQEEKAVKKAEEEERRRKYWLNIENKELLKSWYSKDKVALIEVLEEEWNKMFVKEWRELNDANIWELAKLIESKSTWTEWTREIVEALKNVMNTLQDAMWKWYKDISAEYWAKRDILEWLENVLWNLTRRTSAVWTEVWLSEAWENVLKWVSREQLTQLNKYFWINLNREVDSWLLHLAVFDPEKAAEIAKNIYPSLPWVLELLIQWTKLKLNRAAAKDIIKEEAAKNAPIKWKSVWDTITNSVRGKFSEWAVDFLENNNLF